MTMTDNLYLRPDTLVEPLIDQWYAWSHLIPPATAARNLTERHLKIMDSYIQAPAVHAAATTNPKFLGGPFMDFRRNEVEQVKVLRSHTLAKRAQLLELSHAIGQLENMLKSEARGFSLEPLYNKIPSALKGYVELVYDSRNQATYRLIEPLLYRSHFYDPSGQSLLLSVISGDDRPFVLSTPRLEHEGSVHLRIPFCDSTLDDLFNSTTTHVSRRKIDDIVNGVDQHVELFRSFFTDQPPRPYKRYDGQGARWRYFGHACILLETPEVSILLDSVLSYTYHNNLSRYTYEDLPDYIDVLLITHNHQDHVLFETLLQLRHRVGTLVVPRSAGSLLDPSLKLSLQHCGFKNILEISDMEEFTVKGATICAIPFLGEHGDLDVRTKTAYYIRIGRHTLLFAADSCNIAPELYSHVHRDIGDVEVLFIGMECDGAPVSWVYGPLLGDTLSRSMDQSRRLAGSNYDRALRMVEDLHVKEVYVYAMGQEPWLNYVMSIKYTDSSNPIVDSNRLIETCRSRGIVAERLFGEKEIFLP